MRTRVFSLWQYFDGNARGQPSLQMGAHHLELERKQRINLFRTTLRNGEQCWGASRGLDNEILSLASAEWTGCLVYCRAFGRLSVVRITDNYPLYASCRSWVSYDPCVFSEPRASTTKVERQGNGIGCQTHVSCKCPGPSSYNFAPTTKRFAPAPCADASALNRRVSNCRSRAASFDRR
jgi:hypothetical protein